MVYDARMECLPQTLFILFLVGVAYAIARIMLGGLWDEPKDKPITRLPGTNFKPLCDHMWMVKGKPLSGNTYYKCDKCGTTKWRG